MDEPRDHVAVDLRRGGGEDPVDLGRERVGQALIGIQVQFPFMLQRQGLDRPVALRIVALEGVLNDLGPCGARKRDRLVRAEGIDHVQIVGDPLRSVQRLRQRRGGIEGEDDDGDRHGIRF
jgi:hypothetical protein